MTLQQFLSKRDIELTLINDQESYSFGSAVTVKPMKNKYYLRFDGSVDHSYPFTKAVLHSGRNIFSVLTIKPVRINDGTAVDLMYAA